MADDHPQGGGPPAGAAAPKEQGDAAESGRSDPLAEHLLTDGPPKRRGRSGKTQDLFPDVGEASIEGPARPVRSNAIGASVRAASTKPDASTLEVEDAGEPLADPEDADGAPDPVAFARRVAAGLADLIILFLVGAVELTAGFVLLDLKFPPAALMGVGAFLFLVALVLLVLTPFVWGTTPGMALAELRIVAADKGSPTLPASLLRFIGFFLTGALAGVPLLFAAFDRRGRTLADILSGTTVASAARRPTSYS